MTFARWLADVNRRMRTEFSINTRDAGLSKAELMRWWREGMSPLEFVTWQGEKHDLTPRNEWGWG